MDKTLLDRIEILKAALDSAFNHIIITDPQGTVLYANPAVTKITGYTPEEIIGKNPRLWGGQMPKEYYIEMWHTIKDLKKPFEGQINNKRKSGEIYTASVIITPLLNEQNEVLGFIGTEDDISKYLMSEKKLDEEIKHTEEVHDLVVNREVRMGELKKEIEELKKKILEI